MIDREMCRWDEADRLRRGQVVRLWLDDVREPPSEGWVWCRMAWQARYLLSGQPRQGYVVVEVSLDHDLGPGQSGYDVATYLEEAVMGERLPVPDVMACHSSNPVGRQRIEQVLAGIRRRVSQGGASHG